MTGPSMRLRVVIDNCVIALLCAALATGLPPDWLWWPISADWFLWMCCALSVSIVITSGLVLLIGRLPLLERTEL